MRPLEPAYQLEAERGHRRGVVLGLTMAEIMLLLLFCLLLVAGALFRHAKEQSNLITPPASDPVVATASSDKREAEKRARERQELIMLRAEHQRLREVLASDPTSATDAPLPDQTWRELVVANDIRQASQERGLSEKDVLQRIEAAATDPAPTPSGHDWPPIITLGNDQFRFVTNSASLSDDFRHRLETDIATQVRGLLNQYGVDVVEVVGHTDEQPIKSTRPSTIDALAIAAFNGKTPVEDLVPADNAGLGLARAIAVSNVLERVLGENGIKVVPLSAAQLVLPGDVVTDGQHPDEDKNRRRIEIRVRRSEGNAN